MHRLELQKDQDRRMEMSVRALDEENFTAEFSVSPPTVDRHGTLFLPRAWMDRLEGYRKNPVVLWNHNRFEGPENVIGRADVRVSDTEGLIARVRFAVEENPRARTVWEMVRGGYINAVSHGFRPFQAVWEDDPDDRKATLPEWARAILNDKESGCWAVITEAELREISVVMVPSNREALKRAADAGELSQEFTAEALRALLPAEEELDMERIMCELQAIRGDLAGLAEAVAEMKRAQEEPAVVEPEPVPSVEEIREMPAEAFLALLVGK